ncbi:MULTISPECIES: hypothetical protein [unclassified Arthrobacter]|uniref:hypothetical protein n=1 Tax=unclassified Arthrobacter TaxID=235627 RepID=UPI001E5F308E|nr:MULTISPECIES: hypothetical protein [unclassified Arthrobacter]MCC9145192.1 hypothetical protein [Arthrobacter sp. zg-Y919]MDK1276420.1 hypothetical protein [Arthrobacter sp. zg.Y919]WIB01980.1 hypothetical protein QNO10_08255 [Arthrobacter sp. zg-Y919]
MTSTIRGIDMGIGHIHTFRGGLTVALTLSLGLAGCSTGQPKEQAATAAASPSKSATPRPTASLTPSPTVSVTPEPSTAPVEAAPAPAQTGVVNPQPLSPGQSREDLIKAGVSPEEAAAWPMLELVTADGAQQIVADSLQNSPDLMYDVFDLGDGSFEVKVRSRSIMAQGGSGTVGIYTVTPTGGYSLK